MTTKAKTPKDRHSQAVMESMWTPEQAQAYARQFKSWKRRYRLEDSRVGNSRLVTRKECVGLQKKYGGTLVCVIPEDFGPTNEAMGMPPCPVCKVGWDSVCLTSGLHKRRPHDLRYKDLDKYLAVHDLPMCPRCRALPQVPCETPDGRMRAPHAAREKLRPARPKRADDAAA